MNGLAAVAVASLVCLGLLVVLVCWVLPTSTWLAEHRKAAHRAWVGLPELTELELDRVVRMRYLGGYTPAAARERILRARAHAEAHRRRQAMRRRSRSAQLARAHRRGARR